MRFIAYLLMLCFGIFCIFTDADTIGHIWLVGAILVIVLGNKEGG